VEGWLRRAAESDVDAMSEPKSMLMPMRNADAIRPAERRGNSCLGARLAFCAALAAIFGAPEFPGQAPANPPAATPTQPPAHPHRNTKARPSAKPSPAVPAPAPVPVQPPAPPPPDWPVNDKPAAANVVWDSHGLRIVADNSSLAQILDDVSADTGAKVEGMGADQRIFGTYGPGPARDVLSDLLDGAGYNVLMVGDQGQGTPRQIVLSTPPSGPVPTGGNRNQNNNEEEQLEVEQEPPPEPPAPQFQPPQPQPPNMPIRTPQQIREELQQRNPQMMQQEQNGQPNQPQ
jgi:hypothetical protein